MTLPIFIDTGYILALANTADKYHERAYAASLLARPPFITTEAVLTEIGNAFSRIRWRALGFAIIDDLRTDSEIETVPIDAVLFARAVELYGSRPDKEWGLTDCISFVVMQERGLTHVLTTDRHFAQAGFQNVMLNTPPSP
jgi:predicted nucleic acid-binding protein